MAAEEEARAVDIRDLRRLEREYRRIAPKEVREGYRDLLIESVEPQKFRISKKRIKKGVLLQTEEVPKEERGSRIGVIEEKFTNEDKDNLDDLEKELVTVILDKLVRPGVQRIGVQNENLVPYQEAGLEAAIYEVEELKKEVEGYVKLVNVQETERSKEITERLNDIEDWLKGNTGLLKGSGPLLKQYFDGWLAMALALRMDPRYDTVATDLDKVFCLVEGGDEWKLGKEIQRKQNHIFRIMRGVSAAYRHRWRNMGREIKETRGTEDIYSINDTQMEFVELFFGHNPRDKKGKETRDVEVVSVVFKGHEKGDIRTEIEEVFKRKARKKKIHLGKEIGAPTIVVGEEKEITRNLIDNWKRKPAELEGKTLWIDGVEWEVKKGSVAKIAGELEYRIGSGDKVFVGDKMELTEDDYEEIIEKIGINKQVAVIRETPRALKNLFVMSQDPASVGQTKRMLGAMIESGVWEDLKPGADLDRLIEEFSEQNSTYETEVLEEHIIETARIALLFFCEGAELGWGFSYTDDELVYKRIEDGEDLKIDKIRRFVDQGSTKAATDIGAPFFWLMTEASNEWKAWTSGLLPMDENTKRQILDHEPGWAPWVDKEKRTWKTVFLGVPLEVDVPTTFKMSFLEAVKFIDAGPELRKKVKGDYEAKRVMDLIKEGKDMSEIPWLKLVEEAQYRWYITLGQLARSQALLSTLPTKEVTQTFFGEKITTIKPGTAEMLELMKRLSLGYRDMEGDEDVERFLPLVTALYMAWDMNLLPESENPTNFFTKEVKTAANTKAVVIGELAPKGKKEMSTKMADQFKKYMNQLLDVGKAYSRYWNTILAQGRRRL